MSDHPVPTEARELADVEAVMRLLAQDRGFGPVLYDVFRPLAELIVETLRQHPSVDEARREAFADALEEAARVAGKISDQNSSEEPSYHIACAEIEEAIRALSPSPAGTGQGGER